LAALRKLQRVRGIDVQGDFPFDPVKAYASSHGMAPRLDAALAGAGKEVQTLSERVREGSLGSVLRYMNSPSRALDNHGFYVDMLRYGEGTRSQAPSLVGAWYARNLAICARLLQSFRREGALSCSSVKGTPTCCVSASSRRLDLVEANDYLPK
jgi:hypothetical protein